MIRRPPRSTLFPSRRSSDLILVWKVVVVRNRSHLRHSRDSRRTPPVLRRLTIDRKSTRLNSSHDQISYAVFCLKKKKSLTGDIVSLEEMATKTGFIIEAVRT